MSEPLGSRPAGTGTARRRWSTLLQGFGSSPTKSKRALVLVLGAGALPWVIAFALLHHYRHQGREREIAESLRQPAQDLAAAEEARKDPSLPRLAQERAANFALSGFRQALALSGGESREAWLGIGRCLEILREESLAEDHYLKAQALPAARLGLSRIDLRRYFDADGDRDWREEARKHLLKIPQGSSTDEAELFKAFLQGRWQDCLSGGRAIVARDPGSAVTWLVIAAAAQEAGRFEEALAALDRAEGLHGTPATVHFYRGLAHAGHGDRERAREAFTAALQAAPPSWGHSLEAQVKRDRLGR